MLKKNSKLNTIELPINRGFSYEKKGKFREKNPTDTLPKQRVISKSKKAPLFPQNQGSFLLLQIKVEIFIQLSSRSSQRPSHQIKHVRLFIQLGDITSRFKIKLHSPFGS